jgi:hypothetical protein
MTEEDKSALDIIYSLPAILKKLESKIDVIDNNVKLLNNKIKGLKTSTQEAPQKETNQENAGVSKKEVLMPRAEAPDKMPITHDRKSVQENRAESTQPKFLIGSKKVFGYIKSTSMKPVSGARIKIFDNINDLVKDLTSDKDGFWECRLPAGKFNCEIIVGNFKALNRNFELKEETKELEIK